MKESSVTFQFARIPDNFEFLKPDVMFVTTPEGTIKYVPEALDVKVDLGPGFKPGQIVRVTSTGKGFDGAYGVVTHVASWITINIGMNFTPAYLPANLEIIHEVKGSR